MYVFPDTYSGMSMMPGSYQSLSRREERDGGGMTYIAENNNTTLLISTVHDGAKNILLRSGEKLVI